MRLRISIGPTGAALFILLIGGFCGLVVPLIIAVLKGGN